MLTGSGSDLAIERRDVRAEAAENDTFDAALVRLDLVHGDLGRGLLGIAVDAGRDGREGDALQPMLLGQRQAVAIATRQKLRLPCLAAAPDRSDGMDHVACLQPVSLGDLGFAGRTAAERAAFG